MSSEATSVRLAGGLEQAFGDLYDREAPVVLAYLRAAVGEDAEDLAADTFLRAWRRWPAYRATERPIRHWLIRIARSLALDRARRTRRLTVLPIGRDPLAALETLAPEEREVLAMRAAGLTFAEVGAQLGKTPAASRMAWHRAARRLLAHLER